MPTISALVSPNVLSEARPASPSRALLAPTPAAHLPKQPPPPPPPHFCCHPGSPFSTRPCRLRYVQDPHFNKRMTGGCGRSAETLDGPSLLRRFTRLLAHGARSQVTDATMPPYPEGPAITQRAGIASDTALRRGCSLQGNDASTQRAARASASWARNPQGSRQEASVAPVREVAGMEPARQRHKQDDSQRCCVS